MSSIAKTADNVAEQAKSAPLIAAASLVDLGSQALRLFNNIREREPLAYLGRRRQKRGSSTVLWFVVGATVAGGAVFLLAPRGADLRARIRSLMNGAKDRIAHQDRQAADDMMNEGGGSIPRMDDELAEAH
jgi:hypothetical protein